MWIIAALVAGVCLGYGVAYAMLQTKLSAEREKLDAVRIKAEADMKRQLDEELDAVRDETIEKTKQRVSRQLRDDLSDEIRDELREKYEAEILEQARKDAKKDADRLLAEAKSNQEAMLKQAELDAQQLKLNTQQEAETELKERRLNIEKIEERLSKRELALDTRSEKLDARDLDTKRDQESIESRRKTLDAAESALHEKEQSVVLELEKVAALSLDDARQEIVERVVGEAKIEAAKKVRLIEEEAMEDAERRAKQILSVSIQRYAGEFAAERCVSVVQLPSDEMKGRIIGREGRNIRALEASTGIDIIIDDTPEAVIVSGFDPVRREIARQSLEKLIADGRIHPSRIEEVVNKTEQEIAKTIKDAGERAAFELGIHGLHPELIKLLGRLRYRTSYGQNMWSHSIEVGFLCGLMASELGINVKLARRAGLLHDIGKALTHEQEGSHAIIGGDLARKYGEVEVVRNAIAAHHNEEPQNSIIAHLVIAADALSGARPGARREILETYIKRLEDLERISMGFEGVEKTYAIQAGREIRVLVQNSQVNDDQAFVLSREIARKIEDELTYPGQIKVTVIRETRAVEFAR